MARLDVAVLLHQRRTVAAHGFSASTTTPLMRFAFIATFAASASSLVGYRPTRTRKGGAVPHTRTGKPRCVSTCASASASRCLGKIATCTVYSLPGGAGGTAAAARYPLPRPCRQVGTGAGGGEVRGAGFGGVLRVGGTRGAAAGGGGGGAASESGAAVSPASALAEHPWA